MKQATTDLGEARHIVERTRLDLYAGNDDLIQPFLELGGVGGICVYTHLVGRQVKEQIQRFKSGDVEGARTIDESLQIVMDALSVTTNPIPVKAGLAMAGHDVGGVRLPLVQATDEEQSSPAARARARRRPPGSRGVTGRRSGGATLCRCNACASSRSGVWARSART